MQKRMREYLENIAKSKAKQLNVCLFGYGTTNRAVLEAIYGCECIKDISVRHSGGLYEPLPNNVRLIQGDAARGGIYEDVIFTSPSLRRESLTLPREAILTSDTEIFFSAPSDNVFSVSGSDGKSTTTALASLLLSPTFPGLFAGGNLGIPVALAPLNSDAFLLELSSFNLRYTAPHSKRALLTNVTPNHLDWHADLREYEECKARLISSAKEAVLPLSCQFNTELARKIKSYALVSMFSSDTELKESYDTEHTVTLENGTIRIDGEPILPLASVKLQERHNLLNLMSAIALCLGHTDNERIRTVAESFTGLEHRCERLTLGGKSFINSSIDTTPKRVAATLSSLDRPAHLILGGRGKGLSPDTMRAALLKYALSISLYGEIADALERWINGDSELRLVPHRKFKSLREAIDCSDRQCKTGETVLLSPAATAYGEFRSFAERGSFFKQYLEKKYREI